MTMGVHADLLGVEKGEGIPRNNRYIQSSERDIYEVYDKQCGDR